MTPFWSGLDAEICPLGLPVLGARRDAVAARRLRDGLLRPVQQGPGATDMARIATFLAAATKP